MRPDNQVESDWTFDAGAELTTGGGGQSLDFKAFVNNLTEEVHEARTINSRFDNIRDFTRLQTLGARLEYQP